MEYRLVLHAGTILDGKYRIERVIGSGGFGVTYEARDLALETAVAIKEYYPATFALRDNTMSVRPRSEKDQEMFDRLRSSFLREARTLARFESPAIVRVISVFESHGTAYMVMKYESGPNLKVWRQQLGRRPTQREVDKLMAPLLDSLEVLHDAGFLHRDIAPDNVIVRSDGTPVLLDFGASRRVMGELTGTLTAMIKPGFSPAEQYTADAKMQGPWTDIYALGATLYQTITGKKPVEALERFEDRKITVEVEGDDYRRSFLDAIDKAMRFRPEHRHRTIAEFREQLLDGSDVRSRSQIVTNRREQSGIVVPISRSRLSRIDQQERAERALAEASPAQSVPLQSRATGRHSAARDTVKLSRPSQRPHSIPTHQETRVADLEDSEAEPVDTRSEPESETPAAPPRARRSRVLIVFVLLLVAGALYLATARGGASQFWNVVTSSGTKAPTQSSTKVAPSKASTDPDQELRSQDAAQRLIEETARREQARRRLSQLRFAADPADFPTAVAIGSGIVVAGGRLGTVVRWSASEGLPLLGAPPQPMSDQVSSIAVAPDGQRFAAGAWSGELMIWEPDGRLLRREPTTLPDPVLAVAFTTPDVVWSVHASGAVKSYNVGFGRPGAPAQWLRTSTQHVLSGRARMLTAAISNDGATVAAALSSNAIDVWSAQTGAGRPALRGHSDLPIALSFSDDGNRLISGDVDGGVRVWTIANPGQGQNIRGADATGVYSVAMRGEKAAAGLIDGRVLVWSTLAGAHDQHTGHIAAVRALAFDADGQRLVSASEDGDVRVWFLDAGPRLRRPPEPVGPAPLISRR